MMDLTDEQKIEYFRRSYTAVDGLWFMMVRRSTVLRRRCRWMKLSGRFCPRFRLAP